MASIPCPLLFILACIVYGQYGSADASASPNIVMVVMDDVGWSDLSFNGGEIPTPNIDALRSEGISLNKHYIHLMCSQSRSQILTGRYAMYMGVGKMMPYDDSEIGGIPLGQPTVANWLKATAQYTNYAVGKWHMGYAYEGLIPDSRGFDHFFGFYQGGIDYVTLKYKDIEYGETNYYDMWEDGEPYSYVAEFAADEESNSMDLYRDKIVEYINDDERDSDSPFFMYLPLQTVHVPMSSIASKTSECERLLGNNRSRIRQKYCENLMYTDDIIGDIVDELKRQDLWSNSLFVFTADNGADISFGGCNYPFRGTKGTFYDGNIRTYALISGGVIPEAQHNTERDALFSSLDWTPTFLEFAGVLDAVEAAGGEQHWDGMSQYDLIMHPTKKGITARDHIVINIGDYERTSESIVFEGSDGHLYKYMAAQNMNFWAYMFLDGWCVPEPDNFWNIEEDTSADDLSSAFNNQLFLFDLTEDVGERVNLLKVADKKSAAEEMIAYAHELTAPFVEHQLYHAPMDFLWTRRDIGDPANLGDGSFVFPFLDKQGYLQLLAEGFDDLEDEDAVSDALKELYLNEWQPPQFQFVVVKHKQSFVIHSVFIIAVLSVVCILTVIAMHRYCTQYGGKYKGYSALPDYPNVATACENSKGYLFE